MNVIDICAHIYEWAAEITREQPMASTDLGRVAMGNEEVQFLPPFSEQSRSTAKILIAYTDWCNIEKAVLMPNLYRGYHNRYSADSIKRYPDRLWGVALVDVMKGQEAARELASTYDQGILFGFKVEVDSTFQCTPGICLSDSGPSPVWDCYNQYHQPVSVHMFRIEDIEDANFLTSAYPSTSSILRHMRVDACFKKGMPESNYREVLGLVRNRPNVFIDTSTVPVYFGEGYPWSSPAETIQACYHHVGPEKMMWASNYPGMLNYGTMQQLINLVERYCSHIPESHQQMIMVDNARRLLFDDQR